MLKIGQHASITTILFSLNILNDCSQLALLLVHVVAAAVVVVVA